MCLPPYTLADWPDYILAFPTPAKFLVSPLPGRGWGAAPLHAGTELLCLLARRYRPPSLGLFLVDLETIAVAIQDENTVLIIHL